MATIAEMKRRWESLNLRERVPEIIQSDEAVLIDYNQKQMFEKGLRADGEDIGYYSSITYAMEKNRMNSKPGLMRVDLKLTGAFYSRMHLDVDRTSFEIDSQDNKAADLKEKYGDKIFGLTDEHKSEYSLGRLFEAIKNYIQSKTGVSFR